MDNEHQQKPEIGQPGAVPTTRHRRGDATAFEARLRNPDSAAQGVKRRKDDATDSGIWKRQEVDTAGSGIRRHFNQHAVQVPENQTTTSIKRSVRRALFRSYLVSGFLMTICCLGLFGAGFAVYHKITYVDPVKPDYSALDTESSTYWTDRILIDINTAQQSQGTDKVRSRRLQTFVRRTVADASDIPTQYLRAMAVTSIAMVLAQHDIDIGLDNQLQQLGETELIVSMRARAIISHALMFIRKDRKPAAQVALQEYSRLATKANLKLNSAFNEESFFGAVTVLRLLGDREALIELFEQQKSSTARLGIDQRMKAYRLIAGEQVRAGMVMEALETARRIHNPLELSRAWALILQYSARPPAMFPVEPVMLDLPENPQTEPLQYAVLAEQVAQKIFQYLAENEEMNTQIPLLRRIVETRLMCDKAMYQSFRQSLIENPFLQDRVKQHVLKLLDNPESPTIRAALNMPPRVDPIPYQFDTARDDWSTSEETIHIEVVDVDPTPLRTRTDQQWVQALLAVAQSYQSIKRFPDADRILAQTFAAAQRFVDPNVRIQLLMRIGEQQSAIGSVSEAKKTFTAVAPELNQSQQGDLARLQILARLFDEAFQTIAHIESPENREYPCSFLVQEQIRMNHLDDAEKVLAFMPQGKAEAESRSRWNIAKGNATYDDFNTLRLVQPTGDDQEWERYAIGLIQQGCLRLADESAEGIGSVQKRTEILIRVAREYQLLYQALNDLNDPNRTVRQEVLQAVESIANRTGQPFVQATILTELLMHHAGRLRTEADRTSGKQVWSQAMDACRNIVKLDGQAVLFAQLIVAKNLLETPDLLKKTMPLFTKETNPRAFEETNSLISECLELVNNPQVDEEQQGHACGYLARALVQVGRAPAARTLLDHVLEDFMPNASRETSIPMLIAMVPTLKAMNSADTIPIIYQMAIDVVAHEFTGRTSNVDIYEWRVRDSDIEQIIRSQLENGFVDDAVESTNRLNEPVLRDRLLRTAAYIYLDQGDIDRAELVARRMTVKEFQDNTMQNIQTIIRRKQFVTNNAAQ